jgi:diphosphomevalonate decarboxylase
VTFEPGLHSDELVLNGVPTSGEALNRASGLLEDVRRLSGLSEHALVESENNFPTGTGIASSASGFAALALAASRAAGLELDEASLSRLARRASGSACRSIPGGYVEWAVGTGDEDSFAFSIAPADHWDLADCIAIVSGEHKLVTSLEGHTMADTSPLQEARVRTCVGRLEICRRAILERDFGQLADIVELDSNMMHAVMQTGTPRLLYWLPATVGVMRGVQEWRQNGLPVCYTIDAGPNVHVICQAEHAAQVANLLSQLEGVEKVLMAKPAGAARLV